MIKLGRAGTSVLAVFVLAGAFFGQNAAVESERGAPVARGSRTAMNGFKNEDEITEKFNNWKTDTDARDWLAAMGYVLADIQSVSASKPRGEKADVEVVIETKSDATCGSGRKGDGDRGRSPRVTFDPPQCREGISIKLVSSPNGFNQIDKRWLSRYSRMWKMPREVEDALKLFVGETLPIKAGRAANRMFLDELDATAQRAIISFFETNKKEIISDLFQGDGVYSAGWIMVAFKATANTRWTIKRVEDVIMFYSAGPVTITSSGNLKIGRITMQRKGGDGGRETAKMLQFKINPAELYDLK